METITRTSRVECTAAQGEQWQAQYGEGYAVGRRCAQWGDSREGALIDIPPEMPGETGSRYVARHIALAWRIGYTRGYLFTQNAMGR